MDSENSVVAAQLSVLVFERDSEQSYGVEDSMSSAPASGIISSVYPGEERC